MVSRYLKNTVIFPAATIIIIGILLSCDNPFSNNLGKKVDVVKPTISVETPASGAYIKGITRFTGKAEAHRELRRVEVKIFNPDETQPPLLNWSAANVTMLGASPRNKTWTFDLDTVNFPGLDDGFLKIQFRVRDTNLNAKMNTNQTVELVYIIKNKPSIVKMTSPDSSALGDETQPPRLGTNTELRGQIIDRRGIKPGYPQLKIWPESESEPGDDGWVTLFLSGVDTTDDDEGWFYANRGKMAVIRAANFSFKLSQFTIDVKTDETAGVTIREARYIKTGSDYEALDPGKYRFRIKTSDTFFYDDVKGANYLYPRLAYAESGEAETVGYEPPVDETAESPDTSGPSYAVQLVPSGVRPEIELNNDDIEAIDPDFREKTPHIYIDAPTEKKIALKDPALDVFRLRVAAFHPESIDRAELSWVHQSTNRSGNLIWDNGNAGDLLDAEKPAGGKFFVFTAKGGMTYNDGLGTKEIFTSSSDPYTLIVTAYPRADSADSATKRYTLYLDGTGPTVTIRSMRGQAEDPAGDNAGVPGAYINEYTYTVNGNIQVSVDRTANMGIMVTDNRPWVKWMVEEDKSGYLTAGDTILSRLNAYRNNPTAAGLEYFNSIGETDKSGWVKIPDPDTGIAADNTHNFKFSTRSDLNGTNAWDKKYLWLYVIAQDGVENLGFIAQKLYVNDETDKPLLERPGLIADVPGGVNSINELLIQIDQDKTQVDSNQVRKNILDKDTGVDLTFKDDDGISLAKGNVRITLTDLNSNASAPLSVALIKQALNGADDSRKEWSGVLSQRIMAEAMYGSASSRSYLRDGMYKLDISYDDDVGEKVSITAGDTRAASGAMSFYFCVFNEQPQIEIDSLGDVPFTENAFQTAKEITITGRVRSRFPVQRLWMSFTPDVIHHATANPNTPSVTENIPLFIDPACSVPPADWNDTTGVSVDSDGYYVYYWNKPNVSFDPKDNFDNSYYDSAVEERRFTVETADVLGIFAEKTGTVKVDSTPPVLTLDEFYFGRPEEDYINGKFNFVIRAEDDNGILQSADGGVNYAHVKWWIRPIYSAAPGWDDPFDIDSGCTDGRFKAGRTTEGGDDLGGGRYRAFVNSGWIINPANDTIQQNLPDGEYHLYAAAEDRAGNIRIPQLLRTFEVSQIADRPVLDPTALSPGSGAVRNSVDLKIKGKVTDDDGFVAANANTYVEIRFRQPADNTSWGTWRPVPAARDSTGALTFEYAVPAGDAYFAADGEKQYQIRVKDEIANKNPDGDNTIAAVQPVFPSDGYFSFILKNAKPEIFFAQYDENTNHPHYSAVRPVFKTKAQLLTALLGGWVADPYLESVTVSFDRGTAVPLLGAADQGAYDAGVSTQFYWNLSAAGLDWLPSNFDTTAAPPAGILDGMHTVIVSARDIAGNAISAEWKLNKDTTGPVISLSNIKEAKNAAAPAAHTLSDSVISGTGDLYITGRFEDEHSAVQSAYCRFDGTSTNHAVEITGSGKTVNWKISLAGLADGKHSFTITASDDLENETPHDTAAPWWFVADRSPPHVAETSAMIVGGTLGAGFTPGPMPDENSRIFSKASETQSDTVVFTLSGTADDVNLSSVSVALRSVSTTNNPPAGLTFEVTGLPEWDAGGGSFQSTDTEHRLTVTKNVTTYTWDWTLNILDKDLYALKHSAGFGKGVPCFVSVNARDLARFESTVQHWRFYLDTEEPKPEFANIAADGKTVFENEAVTITGTVSDDNRVKTIRYSLSKYNYDDSKWYYCNNGSWTGDTPVWTDYPLSNPGSLATWTLTGTALDSTVYGANVFAGTQGEGRYKFSIEATDWSLAAAGAGNPAARSGEFYVDRSDPVIVWDTSNADQIFFRNKAGGSLELCFTASDSNDILNTAGSFAVVITRPNNTVYTVPLPSVTFGAKTFNPGTGIYTQTITLNPAQLNGGGSWPDGKYTLTLTVTDSAGKRAIVTRSITVDNTPVAIEIDGRGGSSPITINAAITGRQQLRGKFTEASGGSQVAFVAFFAAPGGSAATPSVPADKDVDLDFTNPTVRADLAAAGWRFSGDDTNDVLKTGSTTLMKIDSGLTNVSVLIPDTRRLLTAYAGAGTAVTTGVTFNGAAIPSGDTISKLQIHFLAIDGAGNRNVTVYDYWIYPEGDRPTVTVSSPNEQEPEERRLLNGRIRIGGNAKDNIRVKNVWFRILGREGNMTAPFTEADRVTIPVWGPLWEDTGASQTAVSITRDGASYGSGWFKANGGGKADVPWYAYINTNGELDPLLEGSRRIIIEILAEDAMFDEDGSTLIDGDGLPSKLRQVAARVVKGAPEFTGELVKRSASGVSSAFGVVGINFDDGNWIPADDANIRGRAAFSITVTHEAGIKEINWTPVGKNPINLLNAADDYNTATYHTDLAAVDAATPGAQGIAVKAGPKKIFTGSGQTLAAGKKYLIWKWDSASASGFTGLIPGGVSGDMRFTTFTGDGSSHNLGSNELMEENANHKFEWVVVVDVHADIIEGGRYKYVPGGTGVYSGRSPVNLRATENSLSVPLSMEHEAELPIDNQPPKAAYTHNPYVAGEAATFGGEAGDTGPVNGIARIVLWFSRKANPGDTTETSVVWKNGETWQPGTAPDGVVLPAGIAMPLIPAKTSASGNFSCIVMEQNDPLGNNAVYGHKLPVGFATVGGELSTAWYVTLDSTKITAGRITAHYIVYDKAGNASYYSQKLVVMNGVPRITRITLATDIRGDNNLTTTHFTANKSWGDSRRENTGVGDAVSTRPMSTIRGAISGAVTDAQRGVSEYIAVNTDTVRDYGVVYDEPFNVRNKLLAVQVDVAQDLGDGNKNRNFRVEYVSGARELTDSVNGNDFYKSIKAGRIYIINEPGSTVNRFPWGSFGAQGENPKKGSVFMAIENGADLKIPAADYRNGAAAPSVWELNSHYYSGDTLNRDNVPTALQLSDVKYPATSDTVNGKSAEFVYAAGAFDPQQFDANGEAVNNIRDFTPTIPANGDGRPAAYPALTANAYPWAAHSLFIIRVFGGDEDELFGDFALLSIRVNNDDRTKPYAQLYDLNPKTEGQDAALAGSDDNAKLKSALNSTMGANRAKGGLWNTGTTAKVAKSGHIEPRGTTTLTSAQMGGAANAAQAAITKPFISEADKAAKLFAVDTVSGDVILRGYAEDDQRVKSVTVDIGGTLVDILEPDSGFSLKPVTGLENRVAFTETVDLNRHRVEWAYLWKTEETPGGSSVVADSINVRAIAYNANAAPAASDQWTRANAAENNNANAGRYNYFNPDYPVYSAANANFHRYNQIPVNLRPYITGFRRNQSTFAHNTRSRQGWYMFARNETAVVTGFNLLNGNNDTNSVINLPGMGDFTTVNVGAIGDFDITAANNTRYRQFTISNTSAVTGNGVVTLTVYGAQAVNTGSERAITTTTTPASARPTYILPWNIEYSPGTEGSELWDDFTQAHIWQSNDTTGDNGGRFASTNNWVILSPAMSIDPTDGTLWESHNESGSGIIGNTGTTRKSPITNTTLTTPITQFVDPVFFSDVYRSPGISGAGVIGGTGGTGAIAADTWTVSSIIGRSGTYQTWRTLGGIYISGTGGNPVGFAGGGGTNTTSAEGYSRNSSLYHGESTWYNASSDNGTRAANPPSTDQFMNPHIVTSYTGTGANIREHIHVSYYDDKDGSIKYRYNLRGTAGTIDVGANITNDGTAYNPPYTYSANNVNTNIPKMWTNLDGGVDAEDTDATNYTSNEVLRLATGSTTATGTTLAANDRVVRNGNRGVAIKAGKHNSIAVTSEGYPVIAYYDQTNQRLKLAVSRSATPILATNWVIRDYVIPSDNLSSFGTGQFVSMKIDTTNNRLHIAAMNTAKRLVYVTGQLNPTAGTGNTQQDENSANNVLTGVTVQVVDSIGNVGRWCSLSLDSAGNPWISYMDESYIGARDGAKVAYRNTTTFYKGTSSYFSGKYIDIYGTPLEGWETMHVPTLHRVENPVEGPGREHGRLGMECWPTRILPNVTNDRIWSAAVSYLSQDSEGTGASMDRYRVAYYVK